MHTFKAAQAAQGKPITLDKALMACASKGGGNMGVPGPCPFCASRNNEKGGSGGTGRINSGECVG